MKNGQVFSVRRVWKSSIGLIKVWTFWEAQKIWKNIPHGFDKSADLLSKRQNHEEDFFQNLCASEKVRTLLPLS